MLNYEHMEHILHNFFILPRIMFASGFIILV